jgi:uncharacterized protein (DUF362 family)
MVINYGADIFGITYEALVKSDLARLVKTDTDILIKPNMVLAKPPSDGATTHCEVVDAIISYLREAGAKNIKIAESAWVGGNTKQTYKVCGYEALSKKHGVKLLDLKDDRAKTITVNGLNIDICEEALKTEFLINVPVLKAHCQTNLTCNMKNLKGVITDGEKRRFHTLGLHKPIAALNKAVKTSFCVVDGICGDLTFEEGGNPVERNMVIAGADPVLIDSYCANLIGYDVSEIGYLMHAKEMRLGRFYDETASVLILNADKKPKVSPARSGIVSNLGKCIDERNACSACYSALICALHKNRRAYTAANKDGKIKIGQGFKSLLGDGTGVGDCTSGFSRNIKGCPPKANDIATFLNNLF